MDKIPTFGSKSMFKFAQFDIAMEKLFRTRKDKNISNIFSKLEDESRQLMHGKSKDKEDLILDLTIKIGAFVDIRNILPEANNILKNIDENIDSLLNGEKILIEGGKIVHVTSKNIDNKTEESDKKQFNENVEPLKIKLKEIQNKVLSVYEMEVKEEKTKSQKP